jgi:hypothetical protein
MKRILVLIGPQGAGNHLWSKVFSLHPDVYGWKSLIENYWEAHRFAEPFCKHWKDHSLLKSFDWDQSDYYFTSISCPLGIKDFEPNPTWNPDVRGFADALEDCGLEVQIVVIGRDQNILLHQQKRLRGESTVDYLFNQYDRLLPKYSPIFLSYELLHLYTSEYLRSLDNQINIPIAWYDYRLGELLKTDTNEKYIHYVDHNDLDNCNRTGKYIK